MFESASSASSATVHQPGSMVWSPAAKSLSFGNGLLGAGDAQRKTGPPADLDRRVIQRLNQGRLGAPKPGEAWRATVQSVGKPFCGLRTDFRVFVQLLEHLDELCAGRALPDEPIAAPVADFWAGVAVHPPKKFPEDVLSTRFGLLSGRRAALARFGSRVQLREKLAHAQLGHARGPRRIGLGLIE